MSYENANITNEEIYDEADKEVVDIEDPSNPDHHYYSGKWIDGEFWTISECWHGYRGAVGTQVLREPTVNYF